MYKETNLFDYFGEDFWIRPKEILKPIEETPRPQRFRKIIRDYRAINQAQQWEYNLLFKILDSSILALNPPDGYKKTGRPSIPISEKLKICCIKQYNMKGARRSVHHIESAKNSGYLFVPNISNNYFNRMNEYMKDESLTPYFQQLINILSEPLINQEGCFAIDGSGFKVGYGKRKYKDIRTDETAKREYIGLHITAGIKTKIIPHAIVAKGYEHDNNFFKPLVLKTKEIFNADFKELYADPGYLDEENFKLCDSLGIKAYIKPKENTIIHKLGNPVWNNSIDRYMKDLELKENRRYTLRNNVEATFHMIKAVLSDYLRHKRFNGRVNEVLCRVVCHNIRCLIYSYVKREIKFPFENN